MKAKDLIKILQACNPESEVLCRWMGDSEREIAYREACSWLVLNDPTPVGTGCDALQSFSIVGAGVEDAEVQQDLDGLMCVLSLEQDFYCEEYVVETIQKLKKSKDAKQK